MWDDGWALGFFINTWQAKCLLKGTDLLSLDAECGRLHIQNRFGDISYKSISKDCKEKYWHVFQHSSFFGCTSLKAFHPTRTGRLFCQSSCTLSPNLSSPEPQPQQPQTAAFKGLEHRTPFRFMRLKENQRGGISASFAAGFESCNLAICPPRMLKLPGMLWALSGIGRGFWKSLWLLHPNPKPNPCALDPDLGPWSLLGSCVISMDRSNEDHKDH